MAALQLGEDSRMPNRRDLLRSSAVGLLPCLEAGIAKSVPEPLRIAYFETYSPLSFVDGRLKGVLVDILDTIISGELGLHCTHQGFPWPRAQQLVERGEQDAMCTIVTPERLRYAVAAEEPVVNSPTCIFARRDNPKTARWRQAENLQALRAMSPVVLSYSANGWAKARLDGFDVVWGNDFMSALRMLIAGRGDVMIENALTMAYSLRRVVGGEQIVMMPQAMDQARFRLLVSKRSQHLAMLPQFGTALRRFKTGPEYAAIFAKYGVAPQ